MIKKKGAKDHVEKGFAFNSNLGSFRLMDFVSFPVLYKIFSEILINLNVYFYRFKAYYEIYQK